MDGVAFEVGGDGALVCIIDSLSEELKTEIRKKLSAVCHGAAKAASTSELYAYKNTLKEFLKRYDPQAQNLMA